ncbi:MAG: FHA domain-containing protein, partial [Roseimicrobium sp.]
MANSVSLTIREQGRGVRSQQLELGQHFVGRDPTCSVVLDSPDVSRKHARVILDESNLMIEDLQSTSGTAVNGGWLSGARRFTYPQTIQFGSATVLVRLMSSNGLPADFKLNEEPRDEEASITISMDASQRRIPVRQDMAEQAAKRLHMLYELPLEFAVEQDLRALYKRILSRIVELIPGAKRGALLTIDASSEKLMLRTSIPEDNPPITRTLIKRAARLQQGFIWGDEVTLGDRSETMMILGIRTGMYVPMVWKGQTLGVICVDNPKHRAAFTQDDLVFLISVAHYAAAAVANQMLQDDITNNNRTLQGLLANFSPKLRRKLLQRARDGTLQPGGEQSNVTILMSDLRGFTRVAASVDAS